MEDIINKLDTLGIYSGKYPVGKWPTIFKCSKCNEEYSLEFLNYDPYSGERCCYLCYEKEKNNG